MRRYLVKISGKKVAHVEDLSFLSDREHRYNWLQRHYFNIRDKRACRKADSIIVSDQSVADDIVRYYFIPRSKIIIRQSTNRRR